MTDRKRPATVAEEPTAKRIGLDGSLENSAADAASRAGFRSSNMTNDAFTVGWICALEIELAASMAMLDGQFPRLSQIQGDPNTYTLGRMGEHNVVMACLPAGTTGTNAAATAATNMMRSFPNISFGLMVGIGGGAPGTPSNDPREDIRLGDVVVSCPTVDSGGVLQYDFGKTMRQGKFVQTGSLNKTPIALRTGISALRARHRREDSQVPFHIETMLRLNTKMRGRFNHPGLEHDQLFRADYEHLEGESTCECCDREALCTRQPRQDNDPVFHYGLIGSANQVMRHGLTRDRLRKENGILCFEMEAAGLMDSLPCLVIRGICDYADSHKNKKWQPYAAVTAAAYTKEILSVIPAAEVAITSAFELSAVHNMLRSAIDGMELGQMLQLLPALEQDRRLSGIPKLELDDPLFAWIFRNMDYRSWMTTDGPPVLCLSGLPGLELSRVSSCLVGEQKKSNRPVLYFFCPDIVKSDLVTSQSLGYKDISLSAALIFTYLKQIVDLSPICKKILLIRKFLHEALRKYFQGSILENWLSDDFSKKGPIKCLQELLHEVAVTDLLDAFRMTLNDAEQQPSLIVLDGMETVVQSDSFLRHVGVLLNDLQRQNADVKVLLTGQPLSDIAESFPRTLQIQHDKERREHQGSFDWIWAHREYESWSVSDTSRLLYIQGKPGSGKSTLTKYFDRNLQTREPAAKRAVVAKFFYSFREGELQRSHFNMLLSLLHDIVYQDEAFFYHQCQFEYRLQRRCGTDMKWDYESLKKIFQSLQDYVTSKRFYLVIDAVDESEENDRRNVLSLVYDICSKAKYCVIKIFIASRPVAQLEARQGEYLNLIRLQDETASDISKFAHSLLDGLDLTHLLEQMIEHILANAYGVFLWVKLVGEELIRFHEDGYSEQDIFELLKQIPTELENVYARMLDKMRVDKSCLSHGLRMLQFVLFARRPLTVDELLHSLGVPDNLELDAALDLSDKAFERRVPTSERLIISCGGNFLEFKQHNGEKTVQVIHQTVREFFLDATGVAARSEFRIKKAHASLCIATTCMRYLAICAANASRGSFSDTPGVILEHEERQAMYLDKRPLACYAVFYMRHHIEECWTYCIEKADLQHLAPLLTEHRLQDPLGFLTNSLAVSGWSSRHGGVLLAAARGGFAVTVKTLLSAGVTADFADDSGRTSLSWAAQNGHEAVVKLLLRWDADVNREDYSGSFRQQFAARIRRRVAAARRTISRGRAAFDASVKSGRALLPQEAVVKPLLWSRAGVNREDHSGSTALTWAAGRGHEDVVRLLLTDGAKVDLTSIGSAPRPWATSSEFWSLRTFLLTKVPPCKDCGFRLVPPWLHDHEMVYKEPRHVCIGDWRKLQWVVLGDRKTVAARFGIQWRT
ncbi:hypothetical protein J3F83DRAFT_768457 [Trichoderma novae-zelandiae]